MLNSLLEVKTVLDEVTEALDDRMGKTDRALEGASLTLVRLADHQHLLPDELRRRFLTLLSYLREQAWRRHSELCVAEIKRFYVALLAAIQRPTYHKN
jgi:hypothetical protein